MTDYEICTRSIRNETTVYSVGDLFTRFQDIIAQLLKTTQQALCYLEGKQILAFQWMLVFSQQHD